ncbi:MAG: sigma-54-dependent transcriptional regulator [Longimicrobiales bacterium]
MMVGSSGAVAPAREPGNDGHSAEDIQALLSPEVKRSVRILIVEDEETLRESCASVLRVEGFDVTVVGRGEEAKQMLQRRRFDVAMVDLYMTQVPGMELLRTALEHHPETLVIVMTGNPSVASSIEALRAGAWDYLPKPFSAPQLQTLLGRAAHTVLVTRESRALESELQKKHGHSERVNLLGESQSFQRVVALARRVATTDASVFITGESGTGKEIIAQFIHAHSRRCSRAIVAVNCAALPEALLESEMFGHVKGSFTGATSDKQGLLETANGGTMFLDELTEMSTPIQAKLLRVIQDGTIRRVGSTAAADAIVNVRFIAATNRDAQQAAEEGDLRRDLYYRLRVVPLHIPPLRERPDDIPVLARHFLTTFWRQHRDRRETVPTLGSEAIRALQERAWPGNVRELQNVIEHAVVFLDPGKEIRPDDFLPSDNGAVGSNGAPGRSYSFTGATEKYHDARDELISNFERDYLTWLVRRASGNMSKAARIAGVDRTTLYRLMEKHELEKNHIATSLDG